ncbi:DNA polymerase [Clostridia bacterium]|nr:DNA polymerase [Clostridia bacterium]
MTSLFIDTETFSSVELKKSGVYRYVESPDFEILLVGYSVDGGPIRVADLAQGEEMPDEVVNGIRDENVTKWAHNAQFERICFSRYLGVKYLDPAGWKCSMVAGAYISLPFKLADAAAFMGLEKMGEGKDLIRYFSMPCKPTKTNNRRTRNLPAHAPEKWKVFKDYCQRDVEVEMGILEKLGKYPMPEKEWEYYWLDQKINDRGIQLDRTLIAQAIRCDAGIQANLHVEIKNKTNITNPNSVAQMKEWLRQQGVIAETLDKAKVKELLESAPDDVAKVLELRQEISKTSVKKYQSMDGVVCRDGRARGLIQFYGAQRTGRYSGRLIQIQNLPQTHMDNLETARELLVRGEFGKLESLYDSVPIVLSELIRTALIPKAGRKYIVADFSAIEARVVAWLAGEEWLNKVFAGGGKVYEATGSRMFHIPIEQITKNSPYRQKAKQAVLSCGYQGSVGALKKMGALSMGIREEELQELVDTWRQANPKIVRLWYDVDGAIKKAIREKTTTRLPPLTFDYRAGMLRITLPSGRQLSYIRPHIVRNNFGGESVSYEGIQNHKWTRIDSFGGKFVENIVQAISRDILCEAMARLDHAGLEICFHVHDEVVAEVSDGVSVEEVCEIMGRTPEWAEGLLLRADGFECQYYQK